MIVADDFVTSDVGFFKLTSLHNRLQFHSCVIYKFITRLMNGVTQCCNVVFHEEARVISSLLCFDIIKEVVNTQRAHHVFEGSFICGANGHLRRSFQAKHNQ